MLKLVAAVASPLVLPLPLAALAAMYHRKGPKSVFGGVQVKVQLTTPEEKALEPLWLRY
jgi:hypothetical protein